ncbi:MAG: hypothetical protein ABMB14_32270, partial [Myxococcota bacterium]
SGAFDVTIADAMQAGGDYAIAWYFDANGSGSCNQGDAAWVQPLVQGASANVDFDYPADGNLNLQDACQIMEGP